MILLDDCEKTMIYDGTKKLTYEEVDRLEYLLGPTFSRSMFVFDDISAEVKPYARIYEIKKSTISQE